MKKIDFGQIVSILANVGVIAGIVFLGFELRQNNQILQMQAQAQRAENRLGVNEALYQDPTLAGILVKEGSGVPLDDVERLRLDRFYSSSFIKWESEYQQYEAGFLSERDLPVSTFRQVLSTNPGMSEFWARTKGNYSPEFVAFIDGDSGSE
jgi:hypothetical protein